MMNMYLNLLMLNLVLVLANDTSSHILFNTSMHTHNALI